MATPAAPATPAPPTALRLTIPSNLLTFFEAQACIRGIDVERLIVEHLDRTKEMVDSDGVWMTGPEAKEMRLVFGGRVNTGAKLLSMIKHLTKLKVAGLQIVISPARQEAVSILARSMGMTTEKALEMVVDQALGARLRC